MVDRPELDTRVLVEELVQPARAERAGGDDLVLVRPFSAPGDDVLLDEPDETVAQELSVDAQLAVVPQQTEHGVGDRPHAGLHRRPVRNTLGDERSDPSVDVRRRAGRHLDQRRVGLARADHLIQVYLVLAEGAGHARIHLDEEGHLADERGGVLVGVGAPMYLKYRKVLTRCADGCVAIPLNVAERGS